MGTDGTVGKLELRMEGEAVEAELAAAGKVLAGRRKPVFGDDDKQALRIEEALVKKAEAEGKSTRGMRWDSYIREYLEEGSDSYFAANPHSRAPFAELVQTSIEEVGWDEPFWAFTIVFPGEDMVWRDLTSGSLDKAEMAARIRSSIGIGGGRVRARLAGTDFIGMYDIGVYRRQGVELACPHFHGIVSGEVEHLREKFPTTRGGMADGRLYDLREAYYPPGWLEYMAKDLRQVHYWVRLHQGYRYVPQPVPFDLLACFAEGYRGLTKLDLTVAGGMGSKSMRLVRKQILKR